MQQPPTMSRSLRELDCPTRMFLATLCLNDEDLEALGATRGGRRHRWVSDETLARTAVHRACATDAELARAIADRLDLRHVAIVGTVRAAEPDAPELVARLREATDELAGWAWALLTDPRPAMVRIGQQLMGECYVRGLRTVASTGLAASRDVHGVSAV